jgi:hypothetical protein
MQRYFPHPYAKPSQSTRTQNVTSGDPGKERYGQPQVVAPVTQAEFIARQMDIATTPTVGTATAYFKAGLRKGTINKVGRDQYISGPVPMLEEGEIWEGDPMDCD